METAIDFDGTVVEHEYPKVGPNVPGAVETIRELVKNKHRIILWTMRSGAELQDAVNWYKKHNIPLFGINQNPEQRSWTLSPKAYAQVYIDDAALGTPLLPSSKAHGKPFVNWSLLKILLIERGLIQPD